MYIISFNLKKAVWVTITICGRHTKMTPVSHVLVNLLLLSTV